MVSNDSIEQMLFICPVIQKFWNSVSEWLAEIGYSKYNHSIVRNILWYLGNNIFFSFVIFICKKVINNALKMDKKTHKQQVIS